MFTKENRKQTQSIGFGVRPAEIPLAVTEMCSLSNAPSVIAHTKRVAEMLTEDDWAQITSIIKNSRKR